MKKLLLLLIVTSNILLCQTQYRLNINAINLPMDNKGILAYVNIPDPNPVIGGSGGKYGGHVFLFSGGFLLTGYANDTLWANGVAPSSSINDYLPGTVYNEPSDPKNIIYVVKKSDADFGQSWQDWINAVSLGADYYDGNNDGVYNPTDLNGNNIWDSSEDKPVLIGDEMTWCVYNDEVPVSSRRFNTVTPKGIEIQQTVAAYASTQAPLGNTIFIRYRLINTGTIASSFDSVIFSIYADPDLGNAMDDKIGCDTLLNANYVYNAGQDGEYGSQTPAFFMKYLQGPIAYISGETFIDNNSNGNYDDGVDTPLDTAYNRKGDLFSLQKYPGARNLGISANSMLVGGDPTLTDPLNQVEAMNYLKELYKNGLVVTPGTFPYGQYSNDVNPYFWLSGNPIGSTGWIQNLAGDVRTMLNTGKFKLEANKPIDIWVAYVINNADNALNSISLTKYHTQLVQSYFNTNFAGTVVNVEDENNLVIRYRLSQNYPNPFNPSTTISWQSPVSGHQTLKIYDVLGNEVATLVDEYKPAGTYNVHFTMNNLQLSSGVYFYQLKAGSFVQTKKMILLK